MSRLYWLADSYDHYRTKVGLGRVHAALRAVHYEITGRDQPWRITLTERGHSYGIQTGTRRPYTTTYTQPAGWFVLAWLYHHVWEQCTWRALRWYERRFWREPANPFVDQPPTIRQDLRCYHLNHRSRADIRTIYGDEEVTDMNGFT